VKITISGKFVLGVRKDLHKELAIAALREGESLNAYCVERLREVGRKDKKPRRTRRRKRG
jgi:predicted HicB family RNase H-like nuclease